MCVCVCVCVCVCSRARVDADVSSCACVCAYLCVHQACTQARAHDSFAFGFTAPRAWVYARTATGRRCRRAHTRNEGLAQQQGKQFATERTARQHAKQKGGTTACVHASKHGSATNQGAGASRETQEYACPFSLSLSLTLSLFLFLSLLLSLTAACPYTQIRQLPH